MTSSGGRMRRISSTICLESGTSASAMVRTTPTSSQEFSFSDWSWLRKSTVIISERSASGSHCLRDEDVRDVAQDALGRPVQARGRVEHDQVVARVLGGLEKVLERLAVLQAGTPLGNIADGNLAGHDDAQVLQLRLERRLVDRLVLRDDLVEADVVLGAGRKRQAHGALRIGVDKQRFPPALGAGKREVNGAGGLPHAPFETRDG